MRKILKLIPFLKKTFHLFKRFQIASSYFNYKYIQIFKWLLNSKEESNFTYNLDKTNIEYLAHTLAIITDCSFEKIIKYIEEPISNKELEKYILEKIKTSANEYTDNRIQFGRRLGWYALVRILKPKIIIETGVDKGLGSVLLCSALKKNEEEGSVGKYIGTDINESAGFLLDEEYKKFGKIIYGDSIESLKNINEEIDIFINDSDHSDSYEEREYETIINKMSNNGIIIADNAHVTDILSKFSVLHNRKFIFFKEIPEKHWYPGAGIGISFK